MNESSAVLLFCSVNLPYTYHTVSLFPINLSRSKVQCNTVSSYEIKTNIEKMFTCVSVCVRGSLVPALKGKRSPVWLTPNISNWMLNESPNGSILSDNLTVC